MLDIESAPAAGRRERNKADKRRRISVAARDLFLSLGYDATTTREIARAAEVGLGTLFAYAADKRDMLFLITNDDLDDVTTAAEALERTGVAWLPICLAIFRLHYEFFAREPVISRLMLRELQYYAAGVQAQRFLAIRARLVALLVDVVRRNQDTGTIRDDESAERIGKLIFVVYQAELREWLEQPLDLDGGVHRLERSLRLFNDGFAADTPTPPPSAHGRSTPHRAAAKRT
jgi:AcrR family transcriptional regulator